MTVIAAVLLTDRKPVFPVALEYLTQEPLVEKIYLSVQTSGLSTKFYGVDKEVQKFLDASSKPYDMDHWQVYSTWAERPKYDQDPKRFMPIATGRNFALDWAIVQTMLNPDVTHLLFLDSDVRPHQGGLQRLLNLHKPLTGGLVPGRGAHSTARYVFGVERMPQNNLPDGVIRSEHGTSGYLLIERSIFEVMRFRAGPTIKTREFVCDDPAFATDSYHAGLADGWYIDTHATADHVDDPEHPLTLDGAINDYLNP